MSVPYKNWVFSLLAANVLLALVIYFMLPSLPPVVPLYYGRPYGAEQLSPSWGLIIPSLTAALVCLVNTIVIVTIKDDFLKKVLLGGVLVSSILSAITVIRIVLLVGF